MLSRLGPDLIVPVLEKMEPNERSLHGRFVNKDAWRSLRQPDQRTAQTDLPLPPSAGDASWQPQLQEAVRHLSFRRCLRLLTVAAASGSEVNLKLVWDLSRPSLFPELLYATRIHEHAPFYVWCHDGVGGEDAGTAAVTAGHLHLLPWLVQHGCPVDSVSTLAAAAQHCDLGGLQYVWDLLGSISEPPPLTKIMTAAGRTGFHADAKLSWLLATVDPGQRHRRREELLAAAGEGAAASGSLPVLGWLREQGLGRATLAMLTAALQQGHVAAADWLVDVAGCPLPQQEQHPEGEEQRREVWQAAGRSGSVEALRWLIDRGVPVRWAALPAAAGSGSLEAVRFMSQHCAMGGGVFAEAAGSRSIPTAAWLLQAGCSMANVNGQVDYAYVRAAEAGDVAMVLWLAREAGCPRDDGTVVKIIRSWPQGASHSVELEQTVRALVEAGWPPGHGSPDPDVIKHTDSIGAAALRGDLPLVRYLREELGVSLGAETLESAADGGCEAVVECLVGAGCEPGPDTYAWLTDKGDLSTLNCLRRLGVPIDACACWDRMKDGQSTLPVARWLAERNEPVNEKVVREYLGATAHVRSRLRGSTLALGRTNGGRLRTGRVCYAVYDFCNAAYG